MLRGLVRKYLMTAVSVVALGGLLAGTSVYAGKFALQGLIQDEAEARAQQFAELLIADGNTVDVLLTSISREVGTEDDVRRLAMAAAVYNFSVFDRHGEEVFTPRSTRHEWLLRERPGGTATGTTLSSAFVRQVGPWIETEGLDGSHPTVILPLDRNGERIGFLSASFDMTGAHQRVSSAVWSAVMMLAGVGTAATAIPLAIHIARRRRFDQAHERIQFLANFDTLTRLLNRKRFEEETDRILGTARVMREALALWAIDIEGLADINSGMGQQTGDEVLRAVAMRIGATIGKTDLLGRVGADDFRLLQRNVTAPDAIEQQAARLRAAVETPFEIGGHVVVPKLSIGIALSPEHGRTYAELARHADLALTVCKTTKAESHTIFDAAMDEAAHTRRQLESDMRTALQSGGFQLFYQPIVAAGSGAVRGYEALIRLPDKKGGHISPALFIPIAEARGFIKPIGTWVLDEAIRQAAEWPDRLYVSVNLSPAQFRDGDLVDIVREALGRHRVSGSRLQIEVVESLLLDRSDAILHQLRGLKQLGVSIAMDDFGTGYSSLGYLWRFPFDTLKIDQSFMVALEAGEANVPQIIETIISLAHHLGMKVTTEGVETEVQSSLLASMGCDYLQGFHFARPLPASRIERQEIAKTVETVKAA